MKAPKPTDHFDVIVVGAGPAGSAAALITARAGLNVLLIERGEYPGAKNVSGAAFYGSAILNKLIPDWWEQAPVERYICRRDVLLMSPTTAVSLDFRSASPTYVEPPYNAFTILRPKFDRWFAAQAEAAGAFLLTSTVVDDVIIERGKVVGVKVRRDEGELRADVVIACDGANSFLAQQAGLQRKLKTDELSLGVKEVLGPGRGGHPRTLPSLRQRRDGAGVCGCGHRERPRRRLPLHQPQLAVAGRHRSGLVPGRDEEASLRPAGGVQGAPGGGAPGARSQAARILGPPYPRKRLGA